ncbi:MAG: NUDIX domain-containing protein [Simkaniaceae bacterium]|nr:NUDIX domain-containing protein [Simkaniaceae bacterium]
MKKISRFGSYGIITRDNSLLLSQKKRGPYIDLWGLPGGMIEFKESPEISLLREIVEETGYAGSQLRLLFTSTNYLESESMHFHHIGIIYEVGKIEKIAERTGEEESHWFEIASLQLSNLTPFAANALNYLQNIS